MSATHTDKATTLIDMATLEAITPALRHAIHPLRLRILDFLATASGPRCVSDIVAAADGAEQAIVSQQLKVLRGAGLLHASRSGTHVFYTIDAPCVAKLMECVRTAAVDCR